MVPIIIGIGAFSYQSGRAPHFEQIPYRLYRAFIAKDRKGASQTVFDSSKWNQLCHVAAP
jgi:hypothetical protein